MQLTNVLPYPEIFHGFYKGLPNYAEFPADAQKSYTRFDLICLSKRIISLAREIIYMEKMRPDPMPMAISNEFQKRSSLKQSLVRLMHLFGDAMNKCAADVRPIDPMNREKLKWIVDYLTPYNIPKWQLLYAKQMLKSFEKLLCSTTQGKEPDQKADNLRPSSFYGVRPTLTRKYRPLLRDCEILTEEQQAIHKRMSHYLRDQQFEPLSRLEKQIVGYLEGHVSLDDIDLTKENGLHNLMTIKVIDHAIAEFNRTLPVKRRFARSSYDLRSKILMLCSPWMTSSVAFTKTLDPKKMKDKNYLQNPAVWIAERQRLHGKIVANQTVLAAELSKRINNFIPSLLIISGATGSGKTHAVATDPFFQEVLSNEALGVINPDQVKYHLSKDRVLRHSQVHLEGAVLANQMRAQMIKQAHNASLVVEGRFSTIEELDALLQQRELKILNLAAPLSVSLHAVLARNPFGKDPCPPLKDIVKGYRESILYRKELLEKIKSDSRIRYFKLYVTDNQGNRHAAVEKIGSEFTVLREDLLQASCALPSDEEIERQLDQVITEDYLMAVPEEHKAALRRWIGVPLAKAIEMHAAGVPVPEALQKIAEDDALQKKYGSISLQPFTGSWLSPKQIDHLHGEHNLHIKGCDPMGYGLHWQSNKFGSSLNPKFNPEANGGFQMKIGYFIVPPDKIDKFASQTLFPAVLRELEEKDENGKLIGFRFFVHPEAYRHFKALHDAGIRFIKPEESSFLGTPTSSYRSWAVRRVIEKDGNILPHPGSVSFIVKMGVSSDPTDVSRLLPGSEVKRCIEMQDRLDKMPQHPNLSIFPESLGFALKGIPHYPPQSLSQNGESVDSGIIIREWVDGPVHSFSALTSVERTKTENASIGGSHLPGLPLIYEVIDATIRKGLVKNTKEFIQRYLIKDYLEAIEEIYLKQGRAFSPHGQNLCMLLNEDMTPRGFALRDHEGMPQEKGVKFLETYTWFYRYHVIIKLLNVLANAPRNYHPPAAAPVQFGYQQELSERPVYRDLVKMFQKENKTDTREWKALQDLGLELHEYDAILAELDNAFVNLTARYFDIDKAGIIKQDTLPSAESGSLLDEEMMRYNKQLWKNRFATVPQASQPRQPIKTFRKQDVLKSPAEFDDQFVSIPDAVDKLKARYSFTGQPADFLAYIQQHKKELHEEFMKA